MHRDFLDVKHFILNTTFTCGSVMVSLILLVQIRDLRLSELPTVPEQGGTELVLNPEPVFIASLSTVANQQPTG